MEQFGVSAIIKNLSSELEKLSNRIGSKMVSTTRKLQDDGDNYATRRLSDLTNYKLGKGVLTFGSNASKNGYNYGLVQEFGRKPGKFPNIVALEKWVKRKVMLGHMDLDPKLGSNKAKQVKTLAFLIGRSLKAKGSKGKFFYQKGFEAGLELLVPGIDKAIKEVFK